MLLWWLLGNAAIVPVRREPKWLRRHADDGLAVLYLARGYTCGLAQIPSSRNRVLWSWFDHARFVWGLGGLLALSKELSDSRTVRHITPSRPSATKYNTHTAASCLRSIILRSLPLQYSHHLASQMAVSSFNSSIMCGHPHVPTVAIFSNRAVTIIFYWDLYHFVIGLLQCLTFGFFVWHILCSFYVCWVIFGLVTYLVYKADPLWDPWGLFFIS